LHLRTLSFGDVGVRNHSAAFGTIQRHHRYDVPAVSARTWAEVFERKSLSHSLEYVLDSLQHLGIRLALARSLATDLDKFGTQFNPGVSRLVFAAEPRPALVDGDDPAFAIEDRDAAAQRRENRRLHHLAGATCSLGL